MGATAKKVKLIQLKKIKTFIQKNVWILFVMIGAVGMYLRFWGIENIQSFGWDQTRDAWVARDILHGQFTLLGPRTGVGYMHIGPLYYYLLSPFFYFTHFDPIASYYYNFLANIINFLLLFYVTKKLFNYISTLFVITVYSFSHYIITINQIPWNVTLMPGIAALIFYAIVQIYEGKYKWVFFLWLLNGFYFHLHFTAVILPFVSVVALLFVKHKRKVLVYSIYSIPLYLIWFIPNIIGLVQTKGDETNLIKNFYSNYFVGFHLRFFIFRIPYSLIMWDKILFFPIFTMVKYLLIALFTMMVFTEKNKRFKLYGYIMSVWIFIPWVCFSLYGGNLSEYYFLFQVPMILYILVYIQRKLLFINKSIVLPLLIVFWCFYVFYNTTNIWEKPSYGGLREQRDKAWKRYKVDDIVPYNEGDIISYFHQIWKDQHTR